MYRSSTIEVSAKSRFRHSMENFRGLSIVFVMLSHISTFGLFGQAGKFISFVVGDATAWFVFISGYLFYHVEHQRFQYRSYLWKKTKFVLLPYLVISVPAITAGIVYSRHDLIGLSPSAYAAWSLIVGGAVIGPMWFIPMITVFFILSPMFKRIAGTSLLIWAVLVSLFFSLFSHRPVGNFNPLLELLHFLGFYLFGVSIASYRELVVWVRTTERAKYLAGALILVFVVTGMFYCKSEDNVIGFFDGLGVFNAIQFGKLLLLIVAFYLFEKYLDRPSKLLGWLAEISFGLFFVHGIHMLVFQKIVQAYPLENRFLMTAEELSLVIAGSVLTVMLLKLLLGRKSRYVIGC